MYEIADCSEKWIPLNPERMMHYAFCCVMATSALMYFVLPCVE